MSPITEASTTRETIDLFDEYVIPNYNRYPVSLVKGEGSVIWDAEGKRYLDFFPGWGCNLLGHCPPRVVRAVQEQVATLIHVPNTWHMESQARWAQMLSERSFHGKAFFCNSGAEANEAAIKLARLYGHPKRHKIITFQKGFHGRTLGATAATAQPKYHEGLGPMLAGFRYVPFGELEAVERAIDEETCAILIEPIQGEGGVNVPPADFLPGLRELADRHRLLLMFDEVQTGCGRTGHWFAYQHFGVTPDVMTLAKALCSGIAGGALLARHDLATLLRPGIHAATFGGNPIAARAGIATLETIEMDGLLQEARRIERFFVERFEKLARQIPFVQGVRAVGAMIGVDLDISGAPIVQRCMEKGLLINCTQQSILRLLPALVLTKEQAEEGMAILESALHESAT
jgi:acetylornithine/N-succinyldiaminopimelate aminotransferase